MLTTLSERRSDSWGPAIIVASAVWENDLWCDDCYQLRTSLHMVLEWYLSVSVD